ncbi:hypothetical protein LWI28_008408 [Acer negundo]|uniref:RNase H type-1 domain-containing protein n=1 Tax=Acer negundo TaxID=4023 RepID=A0AAD5IDQ4_ACENE|nr:hypothetical protein LWI28_008408 [Acer negundo]
MKVYTSNVTREESGGSVGKPNNREKNDIMPTEERCEVSKNKGTYLTSLPLVTDIITDNQVQKNTDKGIEKVPVGDMVAIEEVGIYLEEPLATMEQSNYNQMDGGRDPGNSEKKSVRRWKRVARGSLCSVQQDGLDCKDTKRKNTSDLMEEVTEAKKLNSSTILVAFYPRLRSIAPPSGCLKLNSDVSVRNGKDSIGIGAVIRDSSGKVVVAISKQIIGKPLVELVELMALRECLLLAKRNNLVVNYAEVDASSAVSMVNSNTSNLDCKPKPKTKVSSCRLPPFRHQEHCAAAAVVVANSQLSSSQEVSPNRDHSSSLFILDIFGNFGGDVRAVVIKIIPEKISVEEFFKQPTQSNCATHGEISQANQVPVTDNHVHMTGIADNLQLVKEIQSTIKTELDDIQTKVNFLYDKFSLAEDKNPHNNLHNTSSHHNSMHNIPPNPTPPLPSSRPLSNPTNQHPTIKVSSNNTRTLPQHEQTISKSTPSWMKAPSELSLEDGNAPDLPSGRSS